ncbi:MAG TPA: hypothetical protein VE262_17660 [Blastocatellia bacterium]|nr:hypothetical protein [Blastocatellia bacterium]
MNDAHKLIERMSRDEFDRLVLHLGRYAMQAQATHGYTWRTGSKEELPGGETVETVVYLAIEKTLTGERRWDMGKDPDFKKYLMDVIDSLLYHLATGKDNTMLTAEPQPGSDDEKNWHTRSPESQPETDWLVRQAATPEIELLAREEGQGEQRARDKAIKMLLEEAEGDDEVTHIIQAMLDGYEKSSEIAAATGIDIKDVYKATKRLNRKIAAVRKRLIEEVT